MKPFWRPTQAGSHPEHIVPQGRLRLQGSVPHTTYLSVTAGKMKNIQR